MQNDEFKIIEVKDRILEDNDSVANAVRSRMREKGVFLVNLMASPGAGKTTLLARTIRELKDIYRIGVMEADVDSDVDARTVAEAGAKVIQLHTGGSCHMDAEMTRKGLEEMGVDDLDLVFLENIGNLVCPAEFDVGADKRVMLLSVPEGDDKPLKYPLMFQVSDVLLVTKTDTAPVFAFDFERLRANVDRQRARTNQASGRLPILPLSARTGEGFDAWIDWLRTEVDAR
ncbi:MAG: hydrogenase nickel incorporation protein HypB [Bilifractor sp.]|jgi:hydrogenase nickel incorporation protein HypB|nr:hydrogenase nickel incorporation protein HypB [Lachnospiraceae bacterium]MDY2837650.1 hydrogenase nickel incorporation protein HypB [Bilifractor sp.]